MTAVRRFLDRAAPGLDDVVKQSEPGQNNQTHRRRRFTRRGNSLDGVVVGEREGLQPSGPCRLDHDLRRTGPIGRRGVEMEVDVPRKGRGGAGHGA